MRPAKGQRWDSLEHRYADTLDRPLSLDARPTGRRSTTHAQPTMAARPTLVVDVPLDGPATLAGVPLPDEWVDAICVPKPACALRAVGDHGDSARRGASDGSSCPTSAGAR